ncbi:MAG: hypothetical protein KDI19_11780, partial [Pseudomonadales bacterium]|nr:hypothetical protein [Pseudomonadales bacterium]
MHELLPSDPGLAIDASLSRLLQRLAGRNDEVIGRLARDLSAALRNRDVCLELSDYGDDVIEAVRETAIAGGPEDTRHPLILDGSRLYLQR